MGEATIAPLYGMDPSRLSWAIYAVITGLAMTGFYAGTRLILHTVVSAATRIHGAALAAVLAAPLRYFDANPSGRILNRFSVDVEKIESAMSRHISSFLQAQLQMAFRLFYICLALPIMMLPLGLIAAMFVCFFTFSQGASREMSRLVSTSRSPMFSFFANA